MKINILVPFIPFKPGGGLKVMFEYANYLTCRGHLVTLYYPIRVAFLKQSITKSIIKYFLYKNKTRKLLNWFELDSRVNVKCIFTINNKSIGDGDIIFSTWWSLMFEIKKLAYAKGNVFNLIQDVENWFGNEEKVKQSYTVANSTNLVIAGHLINYINQQTGTAPLQIPFAVDNKIFKINTPIALRDRFTLCMMYSIEPRKGSVYGLEVIRKLKQRYQSLRVILFSVADAPANLPGWIVYHKNPKSLTDLYNQASIFLSPSIQEGCALPPMEAMCCGCATVCTRIDGHMEYAFDQETAILAKLQDAEDMAEKISHLIENNHFRIEIASRGSDYMKNYTWDISTERLESVFQMAIDDQKAPC